MRQLDTPEWLTDINIIKNSFWEFNMIKAKIALAVAFAFALPIAQASADIVETFDTGANGWIAVDPTGDYTAAWQSTGGNGPAPNGFLLGSETNPLGGTGYFIAPSPKWTGNLSAYLGGTLSYDLKIETGTAYFDDADVIISDGTHTASWFSNINPVGNGWVNFQVQLNQTNFGTDVAAILANLTSLKIRGEFIDNAESEGLDNVRLMTAAVPEASTWAMMILGFVGVGAMKYRRRKNALAA